MLPGGSFCLADSIWGCWHRKQLPISPNAGRDSAAVSGDSHYPVRRNLAAFEIL